MQHQACRHARSGPRGTARLAGGRPHHTLQHQRTGSAGQAGGGCGRCLAGAGTVPQDDPAPQPSISGATQPLASAPVGGVGLNGTGKAPQGSGLGARLKRLFFGDKELTRDKLAELGLGAFAAYGVLSNMNAAVLIAISWMTVVRQYGAAPIEQGLWPQFLAIYAGLYITSNFMRPIRLSLALGAAPFVNRFLEAVQRVFRMNKAVAFGLVLVLIASGTFTAIFATLAALGGFPNGLPPPPRLPWQAA